jgi:hypothetical protein
MEFKKWFVTENSDFDIYNTFRKHGFTDDDITKVQKHVDDDAFGNVEGVPELPDTHPSYHPKYHEYERLLNAFFDSQNKFEFLYRTAMDPVGRYAVLQYLDAGDINYLTLRDLIETMTSIGIFKKIASTIAQDTPQLSGRGTRQSK